MSLVPIPSQLRIRQDSWRQTDPRLIQRGEFSSATREIVTGPVARWTCEAEIITLDAAELLPVRQFLGRMARPGAFARVLICPPVTGQQGALPGAVGTAQVDGSGQTGTALAVKGLAPGVVHLRAGHLIEHGGDDGHATSAVLLEDLVADGSGRAVAQLSTPIARSPSNNSTVWLSFPSVWMRLPNPLAWINELAELHSLPPLLFEERF